MPDFERALCLKEFQERLTHSVFYMADASQSSPDTKPKLTSDQERKIAIQAYYEARTRDGKAAVVKQYPFLAEVFSVGNHS